METLPTQSDIPVTRAQRIWSISLQCLALAVMGLSLFWSAVPAKPYQVLLGLLACAMLLFTLVPSWRHGQLAAIAGSIILATACMLSYDHTWTASFLASTYIPLMTPIVIGVSCVCLLWGLIVRAGLVGQSWLGVGALIGSVLLCIPAAAFYLLINRVHAFQLAELNYAFFPDQLQEILSAALLYPCALWLGGAGFRPTNRIPLFSIGAVVIAGGFLLFWHVR